MFGIFNKPNPSLKVMGMNAEILEILHSGRPIMKSPTLESMPKDRLEGSVFEVGFFLTSGEPYFAYYVCEEYYFGVNQMHGLGQDIGRFEQFRNVIAQEIAKFLVQFLMKQGVDIRRNLASFSHNKKHTHVLAYVQSLGDWYPIRHGEHEPDSAIDRKLSQLNSGSAKIGELVSVRELAS